MTITPERPRPVNSLLAAATRLTSERVKAKPGNQAKGWQTDAWDMYDLVGEERFLATTLAGRISQAKFYVGEITDEVLDQPEPVDNADLSDILAAIGGTNSIRAQLIYRLALNLFVAGDGWLAGIPKHLLPPSHRPALGVNERDIAPESDTPDELTITDLEWRMFSVDEVAMTRSGEVSLALDESVKIEVTPEEVFLVRVWRPHPKKWWEADSPTRSSLPVLRELVGLTMHISAQVDSRLAGAGLLIVPQSAQRALKNALGIAEDDVDNQDPFTEALMEAMLTPIGDRSSASAMVPLVVTVPDDVTEKFNYMTFAKPLDTEARNLRDEAIRRLALGQDAPPELLLGTAGMNHWGAWLVREDVVNTHIEPPLALICDALTTQYLWPVLLDQGMTEDEVKKYVIWYDVSHMVIRPNRATDALALHTADALSDESLRESAGFSDADAPGEAEINAMILRMVEATPTLLADPGVNVLREQLTAIQQGTDIEIPEGMKPAPMPAALAKANGIDQEEPGEEDEKPEEVEVDLPTVKATPELAASAQPFVGAVL